MRSSRFRPRSSSIYHVSVGNPLWADDVGRMCFNPVKTFQIARGQGWYQSRHIKNFNSGTSPGTHWRGKIVGLADYTSNHAHHPIVIKLETGNPRDWFVGFNHKSGVNSDVVQAGNRVTIYQVAGTDSLGYSTSSLKSTLTEGRQARLSNWRNTGYDLLIKVHKIDTADSPVGSATISIEFGPQPPPTPPSAPPTRNPSWSGDYVQIGGWRFARTCETCSSGSHFSVSSQRLLQTSQIFRSTGSVHPGPRSDFHGFDLVSSSGLTYSSQPIVFRDKAVQIRDWRIRQIDAGHLSVSNENGNVSRIYRSDGTVHGNNKFYSGYKVEDLGEPTCAHLTSSYLQIGDWRFGEIGTHLSVTHKGGKTAMIYRDDGRIFGGPRTDFNAWGLQDEKILMGSNDGCAGKVSHSSRYICRIFAILNLSCRLSPLRDLHRFQPLLNPVTRHRMSPQKSRASSQLQRHPSL